MNGISLLHYAWVVVVHTVDICPDLYLVRHQGCTNERGGIVGATTLQVVNLVISVAAYETLCDINLIALVGLHNL